MLRKIAKIFYWSFLTAIPLSIAIFFLAFIWLATGPREVPYLADKIEKSFNVLSDDFKVDIEKSLVKWDGISKKLNFRLKQISITGEEGKSIASFPEIRVNLDVMSLLSGEIELDNMSIKAPELLITSEQNSNYSLANIGPHPVSFYRKIISDILKTIDRNGNKIPIKNIAMSHVRIILNDGTKDIVWLLPKIEVKFLLVGDIVMFKSDIKGEFFGRKVNFNSEGYLEDKKDLRIRLKMQDIFPGLVNYIYPSKNWFNDTDLLVSGSASLLLGEDGVVKTADYKLFTGENSKIYFDVKGKLDIHQNYKGHAYVPEIHLDAKVKNLPASELGIFWPQEFAPLVRKWVIEHVGSGVYSEAKITLSVNPDDVISKTLPKGALNAEVEFSDLSLDYLDDFPKIEQAEGSAWFDGESMRLDLKSAKLNESDISNGKILISDYHNVEKVNVAVTGNYKGKIEDVRKFIDYDKSQNGANESSKDQSSLLGAPAKKKLD